MGYYKWSDKETDLARACHAKGLSALETSRLLVREYPRTYGEFVTRNSVIGKWTRMGLKRNSVPAAIRNKNQWSGNRAAMGFNLIEHPKKHPPKLGRGLYKPVELDDYDLMALRFAIDDLQRDHCRWPYGDDRKSYTFCGHATMPGKSYCEHHYARTIQKKVKRSVQGVE